MKKGKKLFYGWWMVIASVIIAFTMGAGPFSIVLKQLMEYFQTGRGMISLAPSITMATGGIVGVFVGHLLGKHKPRIFLLWSVIIGGISSLLISISPGLWFFYVCALISGVSMGFNMIAWFTLLGKWFSKNWGTAIGLYMAGGSLGMMIMSPLVGIIAENFGWRVNYIFAGSLSLLVSVPLILFVLKDSPQQMGLNPDGMSSDELAQVMAKQSEMTRANDNTEKTKLSTYLKRATIWVIAISFALVAVGDNAVMQHQVSFITDIGISITLAASALGVTQGLSGFGKICSGWLADRIATRYVAIFFLLFEVLGIFLLMQVKTMSGVWVFAVVYGLGAGAASTLMPLVVRDAFGSAKFSLLFGFINVIYTFGAVIGIPLAGFMFDATGSYASVFVIVAIVYIIAILGMYIAFGAKPKPFLKSTKV